MASHVIFLGWNQVIPGREHMAAEHFQEFTQYLDVLKQKNIIDSFDAVFLSPHGGDLNGFLLIRGENAKLNDLIATEEWLTHQTQQQFLIDGLGVIRGTTGDKAMEFLKLWTNLIPK